MRKELNLEVENRINVEINCSSNFFTALQQNIEYFKNETLCINLNKVDSINSSNFEKFTINSEKIDLLISRVTG